MELYWEDRGIQLCNKCEDTIWKGEGYIIDVVLVFTIQILLPNPKWKVDAWLQPKSPNQQGQDSNQEAPDCMTHPASCCCTIAHPENATIDSCTQPDYCQNIDLQVAGTD